MKVLELNTTRYQQILQDRIQARWLEFLRVKGDVEWLMSPTVNLEFVYGGGRTELIAKIMFYSKGGLSVLSEYTVFDKQSSNRINYMSSSEIADLIELVWNRFSDLVD